MDTTTWIITDWAGNRCFCGSTAPAEFDSFEDGEDYLYELLGNDYETDRCEYYVIPKENKEV